MTARRFIYKIRTTDGRYIEAEGTGIEEAIKDVGLAPEKVRRFIPVAAVKTEEEKQASRERIAALLKKKSTEGGE